VTWRPPRRARYGRIMKRSPRWLVVLLLTVVSSLAAAQPAPPSPDAAPPPTAPPVVPPPPDAMPFPPPPAATPFPIPPWARVVPPPDDRWKPQVRTLPDELPHRQGGMIEEGYHVEKKIRRGLVVGGVLIAAGPHQITSIITTIALDRNAHEDTAINYIPVAGPLVTVARWDYSLNDGWLQVAAFILVLDSLAQAAGLAMMSAALANPKLVQVKDWTGKEGATPSFRVTPNGVAMVF
jgi:hypothetical protein